MKGNGLYQKVNIWCQMADKPYEPSKRRRGFVKKLTVFTILLHFYSSVLKCLQRFARKTDNPPNIKEKGLTHACTTNH